MNHSTFKQLPAAPPNKTGWPWDSVHLPVDSAEWPRITIVTPSFNQGKFIERTLRSIHGQGYPNLEHIVIDGGSTDESLIMLKRYEPYFDYWISEKDRGQTHALNKGIVRATGEIVNWINSDDILYDGALFEVARIWKRSQPHLIVGGAVDVDMHGKITHYNAPKVPEDYLGLLAYWNAVTPQPSTFLDRSLFERLGLLREDINYRMDWEFYLRVIATLGSKTKIEITTSNLAEILYHPDCKSMKSHDGFRNDALTVWRDLAPKLPAPYQKKVRRWIKWFETMKFIEYEVARDSGALALLMHILARPWSWRFRYTWGALRKRLSAL